MARHKNNGVVLPDGLREREVLVIAAMKIAHQKHKSPKTHDVLTEFNRMNPSGWSIQCATLSVYMSLVRKTFREQNLEIPEFLHLTKGPQSAALTSQEAHAKLVEFLRKA